MPTKKLRPPAPGIHYNVDEATYHAWNAEHYSGLKYLTYSITMYKYMQEKREAETDAMRLGSALDCLVLSGKDAFRELFTIAPQVDRRYKEGKERWEEFQKTAGLRTVIKAEEGMALNGMVAALKDHDVAMQFLTGGTSQVALVWHDDETGELLKGRIDYLKNGTLVDLKSTGEFDRFDVKAVDYGYHVQASLYRHGYKILTQAKEYPPYMLVVVESRPPYRVAVYELDEVSLEYGTKLFRRALYNLYDARRTGVWRDRPGISTLDVPRWELYKEGVETDE